MELSALIHSPSAGGFASLTDSALFAQVFVEHGVVTWPNAMIPEKLHSPKLIGKSLGRYPHWEKSEFHPALPSGRPDHPPGIVATVHCCKSKEFAPRS